MQVRNLAGGRLYFLKLRRDPLAETALAMPLFLSARGVRQIIVPVATPAGAYWAELGAFNAILYPFVAGHNGFEAPLTTAQWAELGATLRTIHAASVLPALRAQLPTERFAPSWRERLTSTLEQVRRERFADPAAAEMAAQLTAREEASADLVRRAKQLADSLPSRALPFVLCHSDLHAGNVLVERRGRLYLHDWDNPILAPKERDLMYIGGGVGGIWNTPQEAAGFYQGYGPTAVELDALAYYRLERVVEDLVTRADEVLFSYVGDPADRMRAARSLARWFEPGNVVERAYAAIGHQNG